MIHIIKYLNSWSWFDRVKFFKLKKKSVFPVTQIHVFIIQCLENIDKPIEENNKSIFPSFINHLFKNIFILLSNI